MPRAVSVVPSSGSTAMSTLGGLPSPISSPLKSIGASSFSPSPITTIPSIGTVSSMIRMASTAAPSALSFSPRPTQRPAARAPASVTRTSSRARLRSGWDGSRTSCEITCSSASAAGSESSAGATSGSECRGRFSPTPAAALHGSEAARDEDPDAGKQGNPIADAQADLEAILGLGDDAVVGDQHERCGADDRGQLPPRPGEGMAADHDPGQDEGG